MGDEGDSSGLGPESGGGIDDEFSSMEKSDNQAVELGAKYVVVFTSQI